MAQRMTTRMAIAMAVANERDMAHSTPLHYVSGHPSIAAFAAEPNAVRDAWMTADAVIGGGC